MKNTILAMLVVFGTSCGHDGPLTFGDVCDDLSDAYCRRAEVCKLAGYDACFHVVKYNCCVGIGKCDEPAKEPLDIGVCRDSLSLESCSDIADGEIPGICYKTK